ncbi:MAG: hypothetical protein FJW30_23625 [Acidobacteria bacterium]|nr:hypothetical protein [Acidobacteriota bacterium]
MTFNGVTTPRVATGALAPAEPPFAVPDNDVVLLIDGRRAEVLFAGMAPGAIGLLQVNARVPQGTATGDNIIVGARIGGVGLAETLMISVR